MSSNLSFILTKIYLYVTAAVSGPEYSGELATSDLMVTFVFAAVVG